MISDNLIKILDWLYDKCVSGVPKVIPGAEKMANEYLEKYPSKEEACQAMLRDQVHVCTVTGVLTGFGDASARPITLPVNAISTLILQIRMIACAAHIAGHSLESKETRSTIYTLLVTSSINTFTYGVLLKASERVSKKFINNNSRIFPVLNSSTAGVVNYAVTKRIADRAYKKFFGSELSIEN